MEQVDKGEPEIYDGILAGASLAKRNSFHFNGLNKFNFLS